jgi:hypothetical protein
VLKPKAKLMVTGHRSSVSSAKKRGSFNSVFEEPESTRVLPLGEKESEQGVPSLQVSMVLKQKAMLVYSSL